MPSDLIHATCVVVDGYGVLLRGPSGAGKSDLALRLIEEGGKLVADDQVALAATAAQALVARCPPLIFGKIEVRGLGILHVEAAPSARVSLVVDLVPAKTIERLPPPRVVELLGASIPAISLDPFAASATAKLRLAVRTLRADITGPITTRADPIVQDTEAVTTDRPVTGVRKTGRILLVTGMSGAGKTTALKALEDLGYEAVDNLPLSLVRVLVRQNAGQGRSIAIGVDIRTRDFGVEPVLREIDGLMSEGALAVSLVFLDCDDEVLGRRFTETRRKHPLADGRPAIDGIRLERRLVLPLRDRADFVIDTSILTPHELRRLLLGHFGRETASGMTVFVTSFSFRHGLPREADLVFDVRFLRNPHYDPQLRDRTGRDPGVADHILADPDFAPFLSRLQGLLELLLPRYEAEGKSYLTIAFGCTGGRHRSVYLAETIGQWLRAQGARISVDHRDMVRSESTRPSDGGNS